MNPGGASAFGTPDTGLTSSAVAPTITTPPASQTVSVGANVTFSVTASGTAPFTYNGARVAMRSAAPPVRVTSSPATTTDAGSYDVVVTNGAGSITSAAAILTVNSSPRPSPLGR